MEEVLRHQLEDIHADCYNWALQLSNYNQEDAKDLLHDSYLKVLSGRAKYTVKSAFKTWVFSVIRNTWLKKLRREKLRLKFFRDYNESDLYEDPKNLDEGKAYLQKALRTLSPRQHEIMVLIFYHGLTIEESCSIMNLSIGAARTHYHRAKENLKKQLKEYPLNER